MGGTPFDAATEAAAYVAELRAALFRVVQVLDGARPGDELENAAAAAREAARSALGLPKKHDVSTRT